MSSLICSCARRPAARQLGHVDQLDVRAELVEQLARGEPVGHDDVGGGERVPGRHGDELGVARTAADEHDARACGPARPSC